jgi:IS6 family transposase
MISDSPFKWRHFEGQIILLCVSWYLRYCLSYQDLEEMMAERGLNLDDTTIYRWVQQYAPELEKRCKPHLKRFCCKNLTSLAKGLGEPWFREC